MADVRLRLRRGRGAPRALARRGPGGRAGRPVRPAAARAAHAGAIAVSSLPAGERDPVVAVGVVVGVGRRAVQVLGARARRPARSPSRGGTRPRPRLPGQVIAWTCADAARPRRPRRSARTASARGRAGDGSGWSPTMWMYASSGRSGLTKPTRKPTGRPSPSSATHDVPVKCWNHSRGNRSCSRSGRPTSRRPGATISAWSASVGPAEPDGRVAHRALEPRRRSPPRRAGRGTSGPNDLRRDSRASGSTPPSIRAYCHRPS